MSNWHFSYCDMSEYPVQKCTLSAFVLISFNHLIFTPTRYLFLVTLSSVPHHVNQSRLHCFHRTICQHVSFHVLSCPSCRASFFPFSVWPFVCTLRFILAFSSCLTRCFYPAHCELCFHLTHFPQSCTFEPPASHLPGKSVQMLLKIKCKLKTSAERRAHNTNVLTVYSQSGKKKNNLSTKQAAGSYFISE